MTFSHFPNEQWYTVNVVLWWFDDLYYFSVKQNIEIGISCMFRKVLELWIIQLHTTNQCIFNAAKMATSLIFSFVKKSRKFQSYLYLITRWHTQNYTCCPCHLDENILLKYWLYNIFEKGQQQHTFIYLCKICKIHRLSLLTLETISASFASCLEDHLLKIGLNGLNK